METFRARTEPLEKGGRLICPCSLYGPSLVLKLGLLQRYSAWVSLVPFSLVVQALLFCQEWDLSFLSMAPRPKRTIDSVKIHR